MKNAKKIQCIVEAALDVKNGLARLIKLHREFSTLLIYDEKTNPFLELVKMGQMDAFYQYKSD